MAGFERDINAKLCAWKASPSRKPLVLLGARQVGKTYALKAFAAAEYESLAYVDFSRDVDAARLFDGSISPAQLVANLSVYLRMDIDPQNTLIVFDEVQLCERALTSLKYFCDDGPQYNVVAAGSLLGVQIHRENYSFPVGKVDLINLHPMNFKEYLLARGEGRLVDAIALAYECPATPFALHDRAMELMREYELIGGMPEVVSQFISSGAAGNAAIEAAQKKQTEICVAYAADMVKYADETDAPRILAAWNSLPRQLAKENHKFQYKEIRSGARAYQYQTALEWLSSAGIAERCLRVTDAQAPLATFAEDANFKLYGADTGLLSCRFEAQPEDLLPADNKASRLRGGITENYVFQQLRSSDASLYYWGTASRFEVEFVARKKTGEVAPIKVKSGKNVRSTSLREFAKSYGIEKAYRLSSKNFGEDGGVVSIPLYAAWLLGEELR